jgi:hypothetical protein
MLIAFTGNKKPCLPGRQVSVIVFRFFPYVTAGNTTATYDAMDLWMKAKLLPPTFVIH